MQPSDPAEGLVHARLTWVDGQLQSGGLVASSEPLRGIRGEDA